MRHSSGGNLFTVPDEHSLIICRLVDRIVSTSLLVSRWSVNVGVFALHREILVFECHALEYMGTVNRHDLYSFADARRAF